MCVIGEVTSGPEGVQGPQTSTLASVSPQTDITNSRSTTIAFNLTTTVANPDGKVVGVVNTPYSLPPGNNTPNNPIGASWTCQQEIVINNPQLWNTAPSPPLYTVYSTISDPTGAVIDQV